MKPIYYDSTENGLILVEFLGYMKGQSYPYSKDYDIVLRVKETRGAYPKGYVFRADHYYVVRIKRKTKFNTLVYSAELPVRTDENTLTTFPQRG